MNTISAFIGFLKGGGGNLISLIVVFTMFLVAFAIVECVRRVTIGNYVKNPTLKGIVSFYLTSIILYILNNYISGSRFYSKFFSNEVYLMIYRFSFALGLAILLCLISVSLNLTINYMRLRSNV